MRQPQVPALHQARAYWLEHGHFPPGLVDERLDRSWRRSLAAGLIPTGSRATGAHIAGTDLGRILERDHDLLSHAQPVMEFLFEQIRRSGSLIVLADHHGILMQTLGDSDFLDKAERVALTAGASWHEQHRGTNAIGTALAEAGAVEINGPEHFLERNAFLTCSASPILSATGTLLGILDISGDRRGRHPHTGALVRVAARMIENRLIAAGSHHPLRLHLHARPGGLGTVAEGIIALSADGWIVGANPAGLALLQLSPADLGTTSLGQILDIRLDQLREQLMRPADRPFTTRRHDGLPLFARIHGAHASRTVPAGAVYPAAARPDDALTRLDTGDPIWRAAADKARRVAAKQIALLIQGESGVGKELFAKATHDSGPRRGSRFVAINCAALPESLIESELFGYVPGAFTGSRRDGNPGRLREAHRGTLFLDEIGDMPLATQTRLLRVLQERQVTPLGGSEAIDVDFALICATHRNLRQDSEQGRFRSDLYYRINGLTLHLPALRERTDFAALTERLLDSFNPGHPVRLAPGLIEKLSTYPWPGNLRQYANVLRTASAMLETDEDVIDWHHLSDDLADELSAAPGTAPKLATPPTTGAAAPNLLELTRSAIDAALQATDGNIAEAARRLGISRQTLYRKIKR
ncbi:MAG: sigma-54-dependent Fis family transcriptional regulator [Azospirillaceae bacterium]|nr:sigma-54-dependent Fis family transcriptional regulator [Azospirillaceae bacterium]